VLVLGFEFFYNRGDQHLEVVEVSPEISEVAFKLILLEVPLRVQVEPAVALLVRRSEPICYIGVSRFQFGLCTVACGLVSNTLQDRSWS
jgi:hypothetical protein